MSGKPFNIVNPADYSFWELLNQVVQEELPESLDQIRMGYFASIGLVEQAIAEVQLGIEAAS